MHCMKNHLLLSAAVVLPVMAKNEELSSSNLYNGYKIYLPSIANLTSSHKNKTRGGGVQLRQRRHLKKSKSGKSSKQQGGSFSSSMSESRSDPLRTVFSSKEQFVSECKTELMDDDDLNGYLTQNEFAKYYSDVCATCKSTSFQQLPLQLQVVFARAVCDQVQGKLGDFDKQEVVNVRGSQHDYIGRLLQSECNTNSLLIELGQGEYYVQELCGSMFQPFIELEVIVYLAYPSKSPVPSAFPSRKPSISPKAHSTGSPVYYPTIIPTNISSNNATRIGVSTSPTLLAELRSFPSVTPTEKTVSTSEPSVSAPTTASPTFNFTPTTESNVTFNYILEYLVEVEDDGIVALKNSMSSALDMILNRERRKLLNGSLFISNISTLFYDFDAVLCSFYNLNDSRFCYAVSAVVSFITNDALGAEVNVTTKINNSMSPISDSFIMAMNDPNAVSSAYKGLGVYDNTIDRSTRKVDAVLGQGLIVLISIAGAMLLLVSFAFLMSNRNQKKKPLKMIETTEDGFLGSQPAANFSDLNDCIESGREWSSIQTSIDNIPQFKPVVQCVQEAISKNNPSDLNLTLSGDSSKLTEHTAAQRSPSTKRKEEGPLDAEATSSLVLLSPLSVLCEELPRDDEDTVVEDLLSSADSEGANTVEENRNQCQQEHDHISEKDDENDSIQKNDADFELSITSISEQSFEDASCKALQKESDIEFRQQVVRLLQKCAPEEIVHVDTMIEQFDGRRDELIESLHSLFYRKVAQKNRSANHKRVKIEMKSAIRDNKLLPTPPPKSIVVEIPALRQSLETTIENASVKDAEMSSGAQEGKRAVENKEIPESTILSHSNAIFNRLDEAIGQAQWNEVETYSQLIEEEIEEDDESQQQQSDETLGGSSSSFLSLSSTSNISSAQTIVLN